MRKKMLFITLAMLLPATVAVTGLLPQVSVADSSKPITWTCQQVYSGSNFGEGGYQTILFKEVIEKATNGRLKINVVPPESVIPTKELFTAISAGTIDLTYAAYAGYYTGLFPEGDVETGPPFAWLTGEAAVYGYEVYGIREELEKAYAKNNIWFAPVFYDTLYILLSREPINSPEDLKGMKVRAPGIYGKWVQKFGGSPVTIPIQESYTALKLGTLDASIMSPSFLDVLNLKEVVKYVVVSPNLSTIVGNCLINMDSLNALPEDLRAIVTTTAKYIAYYAGQRQADLHIVQRAQEEHGVKVINWDEDAVARATEAGVETWETIASRSPNNAKLIGIIKQQLKDEGRLE
ncbi:MAG: TRAP transporter substrate-binding protein DctP [Desulfobacterales bacterium]|nr:TRAP transporter substrate-binding protein DctP [Desulfobacterales bacterium]